LVDWTKKRQKKLCRRAERALARQDFDALAAPLREMLDAVALRAQAPSMTYGLLAELAFRPVSEAAQAAVPTSVASDEAERWHSFRLALKRLRYAAELLEPELGPAYNEHYRHVKKLQQLLGDLQDNLLLQQTVLKHSKLGRQGDPELASGLQTLLDQTRQQHRQHLERCREYCTRWVGPHLFGPVSS
jgi:CHAD domain-containing protein